MYITLKITVSSKKRETCIFTMYGVHAVSLDFQCFVSKILGSLQSLDSSL